jgi:hypothetical protein
MTPSVPEGETLVYNSPECNEAEQRGFKEALRTAFVLVAGGLGERLGYSGIKLALPVESCTGATYLQFYVSFILALQAKGRAATGDDSVTIPLVIMTSDDTDAKVGCGRYWCWKGWVRLTGDVDDVPNADTGAAESAQELRDGGWPGHHREARKGQTHQQHTTFLSLISSANAPCPSFRCPRCLTRTRALRSRRVSPSRWRPSRTATATSTSCSCGTT